MWKWFAALEGWQKASLIGAALGPTWFVFERLPGYVDGTHPATLGALAGDLGFMAGFYLATLWAWGSYYAYHNVVSQKGPVHLHWRLGSRVAIFLGLYVAGEAFPDSVLFLVSLPRKALRSLRRTGAPR